MEIKAWGKRWSPNQHYAVDHDCQCGWSMFKGDPDPFERVKFFASRIVGFDPSVPRSRTQPNAVGGLIIQCPDCFELFWWHITLDLLLNYRNFRKDWH